MSTKEATGAKKEKSFNGSKGKFAPNPPPPAPDKKEVKLSRKESEKVKQANDSTRKSVLGRFFHNLVDSDDSRKKNTSVDAKKKRNSRDLEGSGADLDLPEHGIILRKAQTLQRNPEAVPDARIRASTLSNQGPSRDNRNRWSSYDIHGTKPTEAALPSLPVTQQDSMTSGCRSQSDETLNVPLAADQDTSTSPEGFEIVNHSDANFAKRRDTLRKHAQLLKTIQEQQSNRATRSEKLYEIQGRAANGWLLSSVDAAIDSQRQNGDSSRVKDADQKSSVLKNSSSDVADVGGKSLSENSASLTLLEERSKEIDKALSDKRRILSNLFKTPEEDMEQLTEKDVELSENLTVNKMILMSLLNSDRLTSVINNSLIPRKNASTDGAVDKDISNQKGNKSHNEQNADTPLNIESLKSAAVRLHRHLKLLTDMVSQEVIENDRLKKELNEAQSQLKQKNIEKSVSEAKLEEGCESIKTQQEVTNTSSDWNASTEIQGHDAEQLNKELSDAVTVGEPVNMQIECETASVLETGWHNSEDAAEVEVRSSSKDKDRHPCIEEHYDSEEFREEENFASALKAEPTNLSAAMQETTEYDLKAPLSCKTGNTSKTADSNFVFQQDNEINTDSFYDSTLEIQDEEAGKSDVNRKFRNLESIPEDDDRLSTYDFEQKVVSNDNSNDNTSNHLVRHMVGKLCTEHDDGNVILSSDVDSDKLSDTEDDSLPSLKTDIHSEMYAVSPSDVEAGSGLNCIGNDSLQSDTDTDDKMASETHSHSSGDSIIHDLGNSTDSDIDVVLPEVKTFVDENSDVLKADVSRIQLMEQTVDDLVKPLINLPGIEIDKEKQEVNLFLKNKVGQSAGEEADDLNSKNENDSESDLKYESESDVVTALFSLELDRISEPHLLLDVHSHGENILKPKAAPVIELDETMITEDKITKTGISIDSLVVENPNLDTIPENSDRTQLNKDSSFVGVSDDKKENQEIDKNCKLLSREQEKEQFEKETVDFVGMDSGNCNRIDAGILSE